MTLAKELVRDVYATMPAAMPCNSVFAVALVNAAFERAAQACELELVDYEDTHDQTDAAYNRGIRDAAAAVRALKSEAPVTTSNAGTKE